MKYRKRPVVIEARQFDGSEAGAVRIVKWMGKKLAHYERIGSKASLIIPTLEGDMCASAGDFIIKGIKGEFYPCKPDIFEQTYELVSGQE